MRKRKWEEYTHMGKQLHKHIVNVKHRSGRAARTRAIKRVCAHEYGHRVTRLC